MGKSAKKGKIIMNEPIVLILQNKDDRESVAISLFRAGYTVREKRRKEGNKTIVYIEYWKG